MRLGDDLHQGDARTVQVHIGGIRALVVQALARILLQMEPFNADAHRAAVLEVDKDLALAHNRILELANLIALGQVGIEVVLAVEQRAQIDLGLQAQPGCEPPARRIWR